MKATMVFIFPSIVVLSILLTTCKASTPLGVCINPPCLRESQRINSQINPNVNPCDNFYQFACGKFLENANGVEKVGKFKYLAEQAEKNILELYKEPVKPEEHFMVQSAKKLFQACMDTTEIEADNLKTIKEVLKTAGGGWPLVEGSKWDETKFDWLQATYKLRELGYPYSIFLSLEVADNPSDQTQSLLQIKIPYQFHRNYESLSQKRETIRKIAEAFGADVQSMAEELEKMLQFGINLAEQTQQRRHLMSYQTYTIEELQKTMGSINWLEFINKITGPAAQMSSEDFVILVDENILRKGLDVILKTSKRTQANFLMWKVIEKTIPYLTSEVRNHVLPEVTEHKQSRSTFCLNTAQERFTPSPINVMYSRKFNDKKNQVKELVSNIRDELLNGLDNGWLAGDEKKDIADNLRNMTVLVGQPDDNYENTLLNDINVDMKQTDKVNFLSFLSQANRNHISLIYSRVKKSQFDKQLNDWYTIPSSYYIHYKTKDNVFSVPTSQLEEPVFYEHRPNYLNYGIFGTEIGKQMSDLEGRLEANKDKDVHWGYETVGRIMNGTNCLIEDIQSFQQLITYSQSLEMHSNIVGAKLAYDAYWKWAKQNQMEELTLPHTNYTTNQLFWISTVDCTSLPEVPPPAHLTGVLLSEYRITLSVVRDFPRTLVAATMRNIPDFGKDFNCPLGSPMNPKRRCKIF